MDIGIIGSGIVAQTLGAALAGMGHAVMLGTRDKNKLTTWTEKTAGRGRVGSFAEAAAHGETVMNATSGRGSLEALQLAGRDPEHGELCRDGGPGQSRRQGT
jgi:predicted dinucleotide-binding enzyme